MKKRNKRARAGVLSIALAGAAGCSMAGTWSTESFEPEMARDEFRLLGPVPGYEFSRADFRLHDDGTYNADVYYGDFVQQTHGTWKHKDGKLTFVDYRGGSYTYDVKMSADGRRLELSTPIEGTEVVLHMERSS